MIPELQSILDLLTTDEFPYPVAIYLGRDFDLGPVIFVDAFDVPEGPILEVSRHINELLWPVRTTPTMLPGAVHDLESAEKRRELPPDTVWYTPRSRTHARA